jgi:hypothetical protein
MHHFSADCGAIFGRASSLCAIIGQISPYSILFLDSFAPPRFPFHSPSFDRILRQQTAS